MQKESFYFSHDANAHLDDKILELRSQYGWEGYGIFWVLVEILRSQSDYSYSLSKMSGLSIATVMPKQWLEEFINYCIELGLFVENDGEFYSESLMKRMEQIDEKRKKRAEAGRLGGLAKAKAKQNSSNAIAKPSKEKKRKESKEKETKEKNNIEARELAFYNSLLEFIDQYPKEMIRAFYDYWREPNKSGTKMKFETETTWSLPLRLNRWAGNSFDSKVKQVPKTINNTPVFDHEAQRAKELEVLSRISTKVKK